VLVFNLTYFDSTTLGGVPIAGSSDPAALLEFGGTFMLTGRTALDVLVGAGLTRTEPDYRIAIALPVRF
jgi:hypothetical protein